MILRGKSHRLNHEEANIFFLMLNRSGIEIFFKGESSPTKKVLFSILSGHTTHFYNFFSKWDLLVIVCPHEYIKGINHPDATVTHSGLHKQIACHKLL